MAEALALAAAGKVKADIELQPLSSINQVFDRLEKGDVPSRVVLDFSGTAVTAVQTTNTDVKNQALPSPALA
jgi:hypothetical protein